ncbi:MAG: hypothetical protein IJC19_04010 [Clostridia bacterium]|nr:hypothetical protein [Clostridia bacterium]
MDKKITGIVSYITIIGWLVAYLIGDKAGAKKHLNQGLVLGVVQLFMWVAGAIVMFVLGWIPVVGYLIGLILEIIGILILAVQIYGIYLAATDSEKSIPVVGNITLLK